MTTADAKACVKACEQIRAAEKAGRAQVDTLLTLWALERNALARAVYQVGLRRAYARVG